MVELASLHPLEAEGVPAQRRVRHELRLELADGDRHLPTAETAAIDRSAAPTKAAVRINIIVSLSVSHSTIFIVITCMIVTYYHY